MFYLPLIKALFVFKNNRVNQTFQCIIMNGSYEDFFIIDQPSSFEFSPFVSQLYDCTLIRLKAADIDQEVKERAIACM